MQALATKLHLFHQDQVGTPDEYLPKVLRRPARHIMVGIPHQAQDVHQDLNSDADASEMRASL